MITCIQEADILHAANWECKKIDVPKPDLSSWTESLKIFHGLGTVET